MASSQPRQTVMCTILELASEAASWEILEALLSIIEDAEKIVLYASHEIRIPATILQRLMSYPSLREFTARGFGLPSMDPFCATSLTNLVLNDLILEDKSSMIRFLESLCYGEDDDHRLAHTLLVLIITQAYLSRDEVYTADHGAFNILEQALARNRTLRAIVMTTDDDQDLATCLPTYHHAPIPAPREHHSEIIKARTLAFLNGIYPWADAPMSVRTQLPTSVLRVILSFAAPYELRTIELQPVK